MAHGPAIVLGAGVTKWDIRHKVWDYLETKELALWPRPIQHRIPNFKGADAAASHLSQLLAFRSANIVKINPDKAQEPTRYLALQAGKNLLVPTPRLRSGLFNRVIVPPGATKSDLRKCITAQGVKQSSVPIGLDAKLHVDLIVVGSVAVSKKGWRLGKGEGFSDLEYAMMVSMGAVDEGTVVVTVVHDCQVVDFPEDLLEPHDLCVDFTLTPSGVIQTHCARPRPNGIDWTKVDEAQMQRIPVLKNLWHIERRAGAKLDKVQSLA
uniref:methenyltetrahydrofolate synthase domain-containing protein isoform X3 n=1 Tax=Myxine glutinosa TaxID=7769 RepID=UPI00358F11C4